MSRTKGSKNKPKGLGPLSLSNSNMGNPNFNIANVEPSQTIGDKIAPGAILPEDLELERSLQSMGAQNESLGEILPDEDPTLGVVKKTQERIERLRDAIDGYEPAKTYAELQEQAALCVAEGCDSIEATPEVAKKVCRDPQLEDVGYFTYKGGIRVYLVGAFERSMARDRMTIEQRLFGKSTEADRQETLKKQIKALEAQLNEH